ncbi:hypothetical protein PYCCODRAFT_1374804 [Trametes coccinea BRFM310]|uniref:N-acetyltransferase domain-containing protein n=1 Tax=Trametes coccinea (strain BRFM310) TaxID=1353009 RepID=A0A1Y2IBU3_TRAC3|nr:hypothetical protein PYCCODRAFT_1374804 [Trametes coccinea BRFM310]
MANGIIKPMSITSGELYTAKNGRGELVGFALWTPPGRDSFDTPDQLEMGFGEFMSKLDEGARNLLGRLLGEVVPAFVDGALGIEKAELNCYWCWFAFVREDYQNKGICTAMFDLAKSTGAVMGLLTQDATNVTKYEHLGFKEYGKESFDSPWAKWTFYCMARKTSGEI